MSLPLFPLTKLRLSGARLSRAAACMVLAALSLALSLAPAGSAEARRASAPGRVGAAARLSENYGKLPLRFEANRGQTSPQVKFLARGSGYTLFLAETGAVLSLRAPSVAAGEAEPARSGTLRLTLEGANRKPVVSGLDELPGRSNYLVGADRRRWRTGVPAFERVRYEAVYKGIDAIYYGRQGRLEYDFVVAPGADPARIRLRFDGARATRVEENGDLVVSTEVGDVRQQRPVAYQEFDGARREVPARYALDKRGRVGFELGDYDRGRTLVIDPVLVYSSYLGGGGIDQGGGVAVDASGSAYVAGATTSTDFPGPGSLQAAKGDLNDAFVLKLSPDGKSLVYATYLGGSGEDLGSSVAVDSAGNAYVGGLTGSGNFPVTAGSFQTSKGGVGDAFLAKLNAAGTALVYATYLGGNGSEQVNSVAVDAAGAAYVAGRTDSDSFNGVPAVKRAGNPAYKSTDGGANWGASASGLTASVVNDFAVATNVIYAATNLGVYRSTDGGSTWQLGGQASPSTAPQSTRAVVFDPSNPSVVYAGTSGGSGIYKSTDGGLTFEGKGTGLFVPAVNTLAVNPLAPGIMYAGTTFGIFRTTNGGEHWVEVRGGITGQSPAANKIVVNPVNPQIVYAATTARGVLKSIDGGMNWASSNNGLTGTPFQPQARALAFHPSNPSTLYVGMSGFSGGVYKSTNDGASWTSSSEGLTVTANGQTFTPTINAILVDPVSPLNLYASTTGYGVFKSADGGASWAPSNAGLVNRTVLALAGSAVSPGTVFAGTVVGSDPFVMKLNAAGTAHVYLRMLGGSENDDARGVALGPNGSAFVTGTTASSDLPAVNARQPAAAGQNDAFVVRLDANGNTVYSTYLGGSNVEMGTGVAAGADGSVYVTGATGSSDFPLANAFKSALAQGDLLDGFVTKLSPDGQTFAYSTYLGGTASDQPMAIAVGADGSAHVVGFTTSQDFPLAGAPSNPPAAISDAFVTRLNPAGSALLFSTCFGGSDIEQANGVALDAQGGIYIAGTASSTDLPLVNTARGGFGGGRSDAFVAKFGVESDLSVTVNDSRDPVMAGNPLSYTLTVGNAGPSPATGVSLTSTLPAALTFVSAAPTQGSCSASGQVLTCALGDLNASGSASVVVNVNPNAVGNVTVTANATANEPDHTPANNGDSETTRVSASPSIRGRVTAPGGAAIAGVTITLSGAQTASRQTDADGFYIFEDLTAGGTYVVTPSKENISFDPPSRTFGNLGSDQFGDFVGTTCTWTLSPLTQSFAAAGGVGTVTVNTPHGCPWTAVSNSDWININSGASGSDAGTVTFTVAPTSAPRAGRLTVAGQNFPVYQEFNSCVAPAFTKAQYNLGASGPTLADAADLNGDGYHDVVISTNSISGGGVTASVMLNDGAGHFTGSTFNTGLGGPQGVAVADFNGDARPDIAMWSYVTPYVRIHYNNGSGGFGQSAANVQLGAYVAPRPRGAIAADVNHDGKSDLVVSTPETNNIRILLGDGAGGFAAASPVPVGTGNAQYEMLELADVSGDGRLDLILGNGFNPKKISVRLGDGAGGFGADTVSPIATYPTNLLTGDFDGDGRLDLVYAGPVCDSLGNNCVANIVVLAGDGAGHFTQKSLSASTSFFSLAVADFNNDGKLDVMQMQSSGVPQVRLGDGLGGFAAPPPPPAGGEAEALSQSNGVGGFATADFDHDGRPDLAVADYDRGAAVYTNRCASAPTISGRVTDQVGLGGVTVTLSGAQSATTQTDAGGNYFFGGLTPGASYVVTPSKENYRFSPASTAVNSLPATGQTADFTATAMTVRLALFHHLVDENLHNTLKVDVVRGGDITGPATVNYFTGTTNLTTPASDRSDYTYAAGTLSFAPNETTKSFTVLLNDDRLQEGWEGFTVNLSDPTGAIVVAPASALVEIRDNEFSAPTTNPIDESHIFVRQHYHDFLNREPDQAGIEFWTWEIEQCGADQQCREVRRVNVSAAFFLSIEFQQTGYLVYKTYEAAFNTGEALAQKTFLKDTQQIGLGVVVGAPNWEQKLAANKSAYLSAFVLRPEFVAACPSTLTPAQFVDALNANTGGSLTQGERDALVAALGSGASTRADVLRAVAENAEFSRREFNKAFVLAQYFGYLRRGPSEQPDSDFTGYNFWLGKLDEFGGNYINAEMVKAFITSLEYRRRFGPQ